MPERQPTRPTEAVLHVHQPREDVHEVSVDLLARALLGVQQTARLLVAGSSPGQPARKRFRPTESLKERAMLVCEVPIKGSFAMPMRTLDPQLKLSFGRGDSLDLMDAIGDLFASIARHDVGFVRELIPDGSLRNRLFRELQQFLPQPGEPWALGFSSNRRSDVRLDDRAVRVVDEWIAEEAKVEDAVMTVTGKLVNVYFDEKKITIKYEPTKKKINCFLRDEVVDALLEDRLRKARAGASFLVQVTGEFSLDRSGHPKELTNVYRVAPVDLSRMTFERIRHGERTFKIDPALDLQPELDEESEQLFVVTCDDLGIHAFAQTREQLAEEIAEQIAVGWDQYAKEEPIRLAQGALRLKEQLLARVKEEIDA